MTDTEFLTTLPEEIISKRVTFKKTKSAHAAALFSIWSDEAVARYMNIEKFATVSQAQEMIRLIEEEPAACRYTLFIEDQIVGSLGINDILSADKTAEIGYELAQQFWRRGIMTEALTTFIELLEKQTYLRGVTAKVLPDNTASIRLLENLHFDYQSTTKEFELYTQDVCTVLNFFRQFQSLKDA